VLGAVLIEGSLAPVLLELPASAFYKESHRDVHRAIAACVQKRQPVDVLTVAEALRAAGCFESAGGHTFLAQLEEEATVETQLVPYLGIIRESAVRRELIRLSRETTVAAYDETRPILDTLGAHGEAVTRLDKALLPDEIIDPVTFAAEIVASAPLPRVQTGLWVYDHDGGLTLGDLHLLAARPALGKTAAVLQVGHHVAMTLGLTAFFVSAEMSRAQIGKRLERLASVQEIAASGFYIFDPAGPTVRDVVGMIQRAHARYAIQLAIVDHAQELHASRAHGERRDLEIREIAGELRDLAKRLGIAVLIASQLNRDIEKRQNPMPLLSDLRDGGALEELAASVTFLWTSEPGHEDKDPVDVTFSKRKYRHGPPFRWGARFVKSEGRMEPRT
jgi:replicative DNA helicase